MFDNLGAIIYNKNKLKSSNWAFLWLVPQIALKNRQDLEG